MERTSIKSSNLRSIGYDPKSQILEIEFNNGSIYQYLRVLPLIYESLMESASKGSYLNKCIKGKCQFKRIR